MPLFEITPIDEKPEDEATRLKNQDPGFMAGSPTATELGPEAPKLDFTGEGNTVPPEVPSEKELMEQKQADAEKVKEEQAARFDEAKAVVDQLIGEQGEMADALSAFDTVTNTEIKDVKNLTSIDISGSIPASLFDFGDGLFPNPADFGLGISDIIDLTGVDLTSWGLPMPKLGMRDDNCWTLDSILMDLCGDLEHYDARQETFPGVNYSDPVYDGFDFPPNTDRSNVPLQDVANVSSINMCDPLGLFHIDWPDFNLPDFNNPFSELDLSGIMDSIGGFLGGMAGDGDLFNLSAFNGLLNGVKCAGSLIADALVPDAVAEALSNFSIPGFDEIDDGFIEDTYVDMVNNAMYLVSDEWMWSDKQRNIYNFDNVSRVSPAVIRAMSFNGNNEELANLAQSLRIHRLAIG